MIVRINDFLAEDHYRLDHLLESFHNCKPRNPTRAKELLALFESALHRHLQWEETTLFPLFEHKTSQAVLTRALLREHQEIRERLEALSAKLEQNDADSDSEEKVLVGVLNGHNAREEYALYPELDKLLSDAEKNRVFEALTTLSGGA